MVSMVVVAMVGEATEAAATVMAVAATAMGVTMAAAAALMEVEAAAMTAAAATADEAALMVALPVATVTGIARRLGSRRGCAALRRTSSRCYHQSSTRLCYPPRRGCSG